MSKKGIYFSFDVIVASVIFILSIISLMSYWYSVREVLTQNDFQVIEEAMRVSDLIYMVREDGGFGFGVSNTERIVSYEKLYEYSQLGKSTEDLKSEVGTPYKVTLIFDMREVTDTELREDETLIIGGSLEPDYPTTTKMVRNAALDDGRVAIITIYLQ